MSLIFDMEERITKSDLRQFWVMLISEVKAILNAGEKKNEAALQFEQLKKHSSQEVT